jgi:hypothetical protein
MDSRNARIETAARTYSQIGEFAICSMMESSSARDGGSGTLFALFKTAMANGCESICVVLSIFDFVCNIFKKSCILGGVYVYGVFSVIFGVIKSVSNLNACKIGKFTVYLMNVKFAFPHGTLVLGKAK